MFYPESKPEINRDKVIQVVCNGVAIALSLCTLSVNFGRNPQAQLALLAGALPLSLVGSYHGWKSDHREPYIKMRKQAGIEAYADLLAHQIQDVPALPMATPTEEPKYFDWSLIQTNPDKYAHLAIVGGTGDGKSTLTQSLLIFLGEKAVAIDPHWKPGNYPGIPTVAKGRNYGTYPADPISFDDLVSGKDCSYTEAIATIHAEMNRRYQLLQKGLPVGDRYSFILDEYHALCSEHPKCSKKEVLQLIREARKVGLRLILLVHSDLVEDFGWQGQGAIRKSLRWVRLGDFATDYAAKLGDESLINWVGSQDHPILVEKSPALLPVPISHQPDRSPQTNSNTPKDDQTTISKYLENLYKLPGYEPPNGGETHPHFEGETFHPDTQAGENFSPSDDAGENAESQSSSAVSPNGENLSPLPAGDGDRENQGGGDDASETFTLLEASQVLRLKKAGNGKTKILKLLSGKSPGKSKEYEIWKAKYEAIESHWKKLGLWD